MKYLFRATRQGHETRLFLVDPDKRHLYGQGKYLSRSHVMRLCRAGFCSAFATQALTPASPAPFDDDEVVTHKAQWDRMDMSNWGSASGADFLLNGWVYIHNGNLKKLYEWERNSHELIAVNQFDSLPLGSRALQFLGQPFGRWQSYSEFLRTFPNTNIAEAAGDVGEYAQWRRTEAQYEAKYPTALPRRIIRTRRR